MGKIFIARERSFWTGNTRPFGTIALFISFELPTLPRVTPTLTTKTIATIEAPFLG